MKLLSPLQQSRFLDNEINDTATFKGNGFHSYLNRVGRVGVTGH